MRNGDIPDFPKVLCTLGLLTLMLAVGACTSPKPINPSSEVTWVLEELERRHSVDVGFPEQLLPRGPVTLNLKEACHAKGDGVADDTEAFNCAMTKVERGVIFIPQGTYLITSSLMFSQRAFVLRGQGKGKTRFRFQSPAASIHFQGASKAEGAQPWESQNVVGLEHLAIEVHTQSQPSSQAAVVFSNLEYGFINHVEILTSGSGLSFQGISHGQVRRLEVNRPPDAVACVSCDGIALRDTRQSLISFFLVGSGFGVDIRIGKGSQGNILYHGAGPDLNIHLEEGAHHHLITHMDLGRGLRQFKVPVDNMGAPGVDNTYWSMMSRSLVSAPPALASCCNRVVNVPMSPQTFPVRGWQWHDAHPKLPFDAFLFLKERTKHSVGKFSTLP